jgi:hypothetical protein
MGWPKLPRGSRSCITRACIAIEGTCHATVHLFTQSRIELAGGAAAYVLPSALPHCRQSELSLGAAFLTMIALALELLQKPMSSPPRLIWC